MATTIIHVNQHVLRANEKNGGDAPVVTFKHKSGGRATYCNTAVIVDENGNELARVTYQRKPLACGARCWVETKHRVIPLSES